ncbi:saccharopine dehydrogenase family protein [Microbulbifer sp. SA54]|uniref:saccharopine dehydrogenase family protein n=1 Tax=Microbulbifer sp. SA54 TaxID=3401577 RepID=UPI003AABC4F3
MNRNDIVLIGATGVTGSLIFKNLSRSVTNETSLAIAGRDENKLKNLAAQSKYGSKVDIHLVDVRNPSSLRKLAKSSSLIINAVGPYSDLGNYVISACIREGIDYIDLCGEPGWMYKMISSHSDAAKKNGSRIIFSCGFDSIPSDIGVHHLQNVAIKHLGKPVPRVRARIEKMVGNFSDGTTQSLAATVRSGHEDPDLLKQLLNPFALCEGNNGPRQPSGVVPKYEEDIDSWVAPFMMAVINTKNVHRSNYLLGYPYGNAFIYDEMWMTGPGTRGEATAKAIASDKDMAKNNNINDDSADGYYKIQFIGEDSNNNRVITSVESDFDPGYHSTAKMVTESTLCLMENRDNISPGIHTPASAFGNNLIDRLEKNAGMRFLLRQV